MQLTTFNSTHLIAVRQSSTDLYNTATTPTATAAATTTNKKKNSLFSQASLQKIAGVKVAQGNFTNAPNFHTIASSGRKKRIASIVV